MATQTVMLTSQTGAVVINTPNSSLNGSGAMGVILIGAPVYGSAITSITIKAVGNTTPGMIRLFLQDMASNTFLFEEISVQSDDINQNYGILQSFTSTLVFPMGSFKLAPGWRLLAATQNAETFNVIAEGYEQSYCPC